MICKQTIAGCMQHDMLTNNYWVYGAWYVNKQLLDVCCIICKQTITGYVCSMICKQTITGGVWSMICKQTITGCM